MPGAIHSIGGIDPIKPVGGRQTTQPSGGVEGKSFKELLLSNLEEVNRLQHEADEGVLRLLRGETDNVAEVFAAANKAGIAFDLLMQVRNRLEDAYREIQQMRV